MGFKVGNYKEFKVYNKLFVRFQLFELIFYYMCFYFTLIHFLYFLSAIRI